MKHETYPGQRGLINGVGVVLAAVLLPVPALAVETEMRNDSLDPPATGAVVGDFVVSEMAGVTLTSTCTGSIVAVQVMWLPGTAGQTLENNIWIFDVATPSGGNALPGPILLQLEGPVLTPGFMNEWRHVDEAQTIPINVPVTNGQQFVVALEFGVATNVGGGSASVVRDEDGCQSGKNWLYGNFGLGTQWWNFCASPIFLQGDLVLRVIVDCQEPTGACCDINAACTNGVQQSNCQNAGETFFVGQTCAQVTCPPATGACCNGAGGCLDGQEQPFCEGALSGIYGGNGTTCAGNVCDLGACCMLVGTCFEYVEAQCLSEGGTYSGPGTVCTPNPCPQPPGACCIGGGTCVTGQTSGNCASWPGEWAGPFTNCFAGLCPICDDGDADQDTDIDLDDYSEFQMCYQSPAGGTGNCQCLDMDNDNDVDLDDHRAFESALSGP